MRAGNCPQIMALVQGGYSMKKQSHYLIRMSTIALAIAALSGSVMAESDFSQELTDARQESQIWTTYALNPYLRAMDISVSVKNGNVILTGKVNEDVNKELAEQIALGVAGVSGVDNQISVLADYVPAQKTESYGDKIDDATITTAVKSRLLWNKQTDGLGIEVTTTAGKVVLKGSADSAESREMAVRLAENTNGVQGVDNQLKLDKSKGGVKLAANKGNTALSDTWITAKVKSTYMYSSNVNSSDIEVTTTKGVVTLKGKVESGVEQALAVKLAENIKGVKSVHSKGLGHL
jgi:hyperosmotically inducible periplasmic protein